MRAIQRMCVERSSWLPLLVLLLASAGCATGRSLPHPIFEPSSEMKTAGRYDTERDLRACQHTVWETAPWSMQPHRLIPPVLAPSGVVLGTMDVPHPVLSRQAYQRGLEHCLMARGYEVRGWQ
ncbi:hypothetical protein [Candidatus Nitrospira bockiana]